MRASKNNSKELPAAQQVLFSALRMFHDRTAVAKVAEKSRRGWLHSYQAASRGKLARIVNGWKAMTRRQRNKLNATALEKRIATDQQRVWLHSGKTRESGVDLIFGAGIKDMDLHPQ
jgi:hypothetical protein